MSRNGRYFWNPVVYGFVTLLPFPDYFFRLLDQIVGEVKLKNEADRNRLSEGLIELEKCAVELGKEETQCMYRFLSRRGQIWRMPSLNAIDSYALSFSVGVL